MIPICNQPHRIEYMHRDKNLIPLSHQHQHTLALCVRLDRAIQSGNVDLGAWQAELQEQFEQEISPHFSVEEKKIFPAAARFPELKPLVRQLMIEHAILRGLFSRAAKHKLNVVQLERLVENLASHIRKEERDLFEGMQNLMEPKQLATMGEALEHVLSAAAPECAMRK